MVWQALQPDCWMPLLWALVPKSTPLLELLGHSHVFLQLRGKPDIEGPSFLFGVQAVAGSIVQRCAPAMLSFGLSRLKIWGSGQEIAPAEGWWRLPQANLPDQA